MTRIEVWATVPEAKERKALMKNVRLWAQSYSELENRVYMTYEGGDMDLVNLILTTFEGYKEHSITIRKVR